MPTCFVIQPFDGGKFDKRFNDVYQHAIKDAHLDPYRVDKDPRADIPIDEIERGIRESAVCLADITLDNPNVWYEVGYAYASNKPVCLLSSDERAAKFPFDIQHRRIITYKSESVSDFETLRSGISERLLAMVEKAAQLTTLAGADLLARTDGLSPHEIATPCILIERDLHEDGFVSGTQLIREMEAAGFTRLAAAVAVNCLQANRLVHFKMRDDGFRGEEKAYGLTDDGRKWLIQNQSKLSLTRPAAASPHYEPIQEDDLQF